MTKFFINKCTNTTGPSIFGHRLKNSLETMGWKFSKNDCDYNIGISQGDRLGSALNVLRLDGLYYDTENTIGNTDLLNKPLKQAYDSFDRLVFQSRYGSNLFYHNFGASSKPSTVIYNGVPSSFSPIGKSFKFPWDKTLICSASWRAHKRLKDIVQGFRRFSGKNVGLAVLGTCNERVEADNVMYFGNIYPENLPFYLRGADALVHLTWLDCCPNSVVEALACGLPVLCSSNGGTTELVSDCGIVLDLEEEYNFERVALYKPPVSDPDVVFKGMKSILDWKTSINRPDLSIDYVAKEYINFMENKDVF